MLEDYEDEVNEVFNRKIGFFKDASEVTLVICKIGFSGR